MKRVGRLAVVLLFSALVFGACSLSGSSDKESATSRSLTGSTPAVNALPGTPGAAEGTPRTVHPILLAPPVLVAHAATGEQQSNYGSYYWMISSGLADKASARGIEIQKDPLMVEKDETITFSWDQQNSESDTTLTDLNINVYPEESSIMTAVTAKGTAKGFKAQGTPTVSSPLPTSNPSWKVGLGPGKYFVQVNATWSNPIVPDKIRNCEYGFFFQVQ